MLFGYVVSDGAAILQAFLMTTGACLNFGPMHALGVVGMSRRVPEFAYVIAPFFQFGSPATLFLLPSALLALQLKTTLVLWGSGLRFAVLVEASAIHVELPRSRCLEHTALSWRRGTERKGKCLCVHFSKCTCLALPQRHRSHVSWCCGVSVRRVENVRVGPHLCSSECGPFTAQLCIWTAKPAEPMVRATLLKL